jgi:hypothetical protein
MINDKLQVTSTTSNDRCAISDLTGGNIYANRSNTNLAIKHLLSEMESSNIEQTACFTVRTNR